MSTVLSRFRSLERHLWWDIDSTVVGDTGCIPPCTHDLHEMEAEDQMYANRPISFDFVYTPDTRFAMQVMSSPVFAMFYGVDLL